MAVPFVVVVVVVVEASVAVVDRVCGLRSERKEYIAAVIPAPVAALTAAMISKVVLDISWEIELDGSSCRGAIKCLYTSVHDEGHENVGSHAWL